MTLTSEVNVAAAKKRPLAEIAAMWLCNPDASTEASCFPEKLKRRNSFLAEHDRRTPDALDCIADCSDIAGLLSCAF